MHDRIAVLSAHPHVVGEGPSWVAAEDRLYWVDIIDKTLSWLDWSAFADAEARSLRDVDAGTTIKGGDFGARVVDLPIGHWRSPGLICGVVPRQGGGLLLGLERSLASFDTETGDLKPLLELEGERPGNRLNEMKCDPLGRLWVGTMQNNVASDGTEKPIEDDAGALYVVRQDGSTRRVLDGIGISNTLAWTPDGRRLYFADTLKDVIWTFDVDADTGALSNQEVLFVGAESGDSLGAPDGSALDEDGYLWNARFGAGCVIRIAPDGAIDRKVELPVRNPTSCSFAGPNLDLLAVTSARFTLPEAALAGNPLEGALLVIKTEVPGVPTYSCAL